MRIIYLLIWFALLSCGLHAQQQAPCSDSLHRQFDFWIGEWEVHNQQGRLAGNSHISLILDSCIILEEWTSANQFNGRRYTGKSFNSYNAVTRQWQQTWVDNAGGSTEFLFGARIADTVFFRTAPFPFSPDTTATRKLRFIRLSDDRVRQWGEISKDDEKSWITEYDLVYTRKKMNASAAFDSLLRKMEIAYTAKDFQTISSIYSANGAITGPGTTVVGGTAITEYWKKLVELGGSWKLESVSVERSGDYCWQKGTSTITDAKANQHRVVFIITWKQEDAEWKILQDAYW